MLTTIGDCAFAILRNVCASSAPVIGALFIGGAATVWAEDCGVRSRRDARTTPTARPETRTSRVYTTLVVLRVDIIPPVKLSSHSHTTRDSRARIESGRSRLRRAGQPPC